MDKVHRLVEASLRQAAAEAVQETELGKVAQAAAAQVLAALLLLEVPQLRQVRGMPAAPMVVHQIMAVVVAARELSVRTGLR